MGDTHDLGLILDARIPIIVIESPDEKQVLELLLRFAMRRQLGFYEWSVTRGVRRGGFGTDTPNDTDLTDPEALLAHIAGTAGPALYALCDFHPYLAGEPTVTRLLKDVALDFDRLGNTLVLVSHALDIPLELGRYTATFKLRLPSDEELMALVRAQADARARWIMLSWLGWSLALDQFNTRYQYGANWNDGPAPISVLLADSVQGLRNWAKTRTVPA